MDAHTPEEQRIIDLLNDRDERALTLLSQRFGAYCRTVAMNVTGCREDAEECVNDTWLQVWNTIPPQDPPSLKAYVACLCRRRAIDSRRRSHRQKRDRELEVVLNELEAVTPAEEDGEGLLRTITEFLRSQSELDRDLFVGRYFYALSPQVLAEDQGLSRNAVNLRLKRIRDQLRIYLNERGYTV